MLSEGYILHSRFQSSIVKQEDELNMSSDIDPSDLAFYNVIEGGMNLGCRFRSEIHKKSLIPGSNLTTFRHDEPVDVPSISPTDVEFDSIPDNQLGLDVTQPTTENLNKCLVVIFMATYANIWQPFSIPSGAQGQSLFQGPSES